MYGTLYVCHTSKSNNDGISNMSIYERRQLNLPVSFRIDNRMKR